MEIYQSIQWFATNGYPLLLFQLSFKMLRCILLLCLLNPKVLASYSFWSYVLWSSQISKVYESVEWDFASNFNYLGFHSGMYIYLISHGVDTTQKSWPSESSSKEKYGMNISSVEKQEYPGQHFNMSCMPSSE